MRVIHINENGCHPVTAYTQTARNGAKYYAITHGEEGRGRWQIRLPLGVRDFPALPDSDFTLHGDEYALVPLRKTDAKGNSMHLLGKGNPDGSYLVLWSLSPGYRGGATFEITGDARLIATGYEADGIAGRVGGAACPVVKVDGPCTLSWHRDGRLYGSPADYSAVFDGATWTVGADDELALEDAVFTLGARI